MKVPTYETKVSAQPAGVPSRQIPVMPEEAFGTSGKEMQQAGQIISDLGQKLASHALKRQEQQNVQQVEDAFTSYSKEMGNRLLSSEIEKVDHEDGTQSARPYGLLNRKKADASGVLTDYDTYDAETRTKYLDSLGNDYQRSLLSQKMEKASIAKYNEVAKHEQKEYRSNYSSLMENSLAQQVTDAALSQDKDSLLASMINTSHTQMEFDDMEGLDPEVSKTNRQKAVYDVVQSAAMASLERDPSGDKAQELIDVASGADEAIALTSQNKSKLEKAVAKTVKANKVINDKKKTKADLNNFFTILDGMRKGEVTLKNQSDIMQFQAEGLPKGAAEAMIQFISAPQAEDLEKEGSFVYANDVERSQAFTKYAIDIMRTSSDEELSKTLVDLMGTEKFFSTVEGRKQAMLLLNIANKLGREEQAAERKVAEEAVNSVIKWQEESGITNGQGLLDLHRYILEGMNPKDAAQRAMEEGVQREVDSGESHTRMTEKIIDESKKVVDEPEYAPVALKQIDKSLYENLVAQGYTYTDAYNATLEITKDVQPKRGEEPDYDPDSMLDKLAEINEKAKDIIPGWRFNSTILEGFIGAAHERSKLLRDMKDRGFGEEAEFFLSESVVKPLGRAIASDLPAGFISIARAGIKQIKEIAEKQLAEDRAVFGISQEEFEARTPEQKARIELNTKIYQSMQNLEDKAERVRELFLASAGEEILRMDPDTFQGDFMENPSWTRAIAGVAQSAPMMALGLMATAYSGSPAVGGALIALPETAQRYNEIVEEGVVSDSTANAMLIMDTAVMAGLESISLGTFAKGIRPLGKAGRRVVRSLAEKGVSQQGRRFIVTAGKRALLMSEMAIQEGPIEEGLQQVWGNSVEAIGLEKTIDLTEGLMESMIVGALSGLMFGGFSPSNVRRTEGIIKEAKDAGVDVDKMTEEVGKVIEENGQKIYDKTMKKVDKADAKLKRMESKEAEEIKPEKPTEVPEQVPETFKDSAEAVAFGEVATPEQVNQLQERSDEFYAKADKIFAKGKDATPAQVQEAFNLTVEGQKFREAVEVAEGKLDAIPESMKKEIQPEELASPIPAETLPTTQEAKKALEQLIGEQVETPTTGYGKIAFKEAKTAKGKARQMLSEISESRFFNPLKEAMKFLSPAHVTSQSKKAAMILRKHLAKLAHTAAVTTNSLKIAKKAFDVMPREDQVNFIDNMENGREQETKELQKFADLMRKTLDKNRDAIISLGKGHLQSYYENYFPHIWEDSKKAKNVIMQMFGTKKFEGTKSFLKKRTVISFKEGIEKGLKPQSYNPVDLVIAKTFEMQRYVMAQETIQEYKNENLVKFNYSKKKMPEGYTRINDNAFTVFMPPEITMAEAYDGILVDQLMDFAKFLGIDAKRFTKLKGKQSVWGYAQEGKPDKVRTKFGGQASILTHEIGHILGIRYKLYDSIVNKGGEKINKEWDKLADLRFEKSNPTVEFQQYVRDAREKEAVLLEAFIHAPNKFKKVAPNLYKEFFDFLNNHTELRPLLDVEPSLKLSTSKAPVEIPGFTTLGYFIAPDDVALVVNNYLSPGLRQSKNRLVAGTYASLRFVGNALNQAQLALSGFHAFNVTTDMAISTFGIGLQKATNPGFRMEGIKDLVSSFIAPVKYVWDGQRIKKAYEQTGLEDIKDPRMKAMIQSVILAGGRVTMDKFYYNNQIKQFKKTMSDIFKGSGMEKVQGVLRLPMETIGAALEGFMIPVMEWYIPTGKIGLFAKMAEYQLARYDAGQINDQQLWIQLTKSWDSVDNRMGQLVYDNLFWNKTLKDSLMLGIRSVGWNLGSHREYGGAVLDLVRTKGRLREGDQFISNKMAYFAGAAALYAIMGAVVQYAMSGIEPEEPKDYFFPRTGEKDANGNWVRISMPTYAKDIYSLVTRPIQTYEHKVNPVISFMDDLLKNEDFFGTEIRHESDPMLKQMVDVSEYVATEFLPFSVRNYERLQKAEDKPLKHALISVTGIAVAPSYITKTTAQKLMARYNSESASRVKRTEKEYEQMEYKRMFINKIRKGEEVDMQEAYQVLGKRKYNEAFNEAHKSSFVVQFKRLRFRHALSVYNVSNKQERKQVRRILTTKYLREKNNGTIEENEETYYNLLIGKK